MKKTIRLTESDVHRMVKESLNRILTEKNRTLGNKSMDRIHKKEDDYSKKVYGDKYGKTNDRQSKMYFPNGDVDIKNNVDVANGLFSLGNAKLSPDTLLINFTSALGCPSMNDCPITQKACYAVAGENRLPGVRRKNLIVQNLVNHAQAKNLLGGLFDIAELYVIEAKEHSKMPIQYIRYNEAGDFKNQDMLVAAAKFSKKMRDEYGIISMAYTANPRLDPTEEVDGEPIDTIIAINRSRNDIPHSPGSLNRNFFGIKMQDFSTDPNINLDNAYSDVDYVGDKDLNRLKVETPLKDKYGHPSIPVLNVGSWDGGSGYYYVCPCSFWRYNKDKATMEFLKSLGVVEEGEVLPETPQNRSKFIKERLNDAELKRLNSLLNKIESPCGIKCCVCHDFSGGVTRDGKENIKDYAIVAATHGATASNYNAEYAAAKRNGDDTVEYSKDNKRGLETKYRYENDAPIRQDLLFKKDNAAE